MWLLSKDFNQSSLGAKHYDVVHGGTVTNLTRSLRKLTIHNRLRFFEDATIKDPAEGDQWAFLCTLSEQNPRLSKLRLDFGPAFSPTPDDIDRIRKSCPQLKSIELIMENRMVRDIASNSYEAESVFYESEWFYQKSSRANNIVY